MSKNLIVIGAGAGGASAAAEARRKDPGLTVTMIERTAYTSTAACAAVLHRRLSKDERKLVQGSSSSGSRGSKSSRTRCRSRGPKEQRCVRRAGDVPLIPRLRTGVKAVTPGCRKRTGRSLRPEAAHRRIRIKQLSGHARPAGVIVGAGFIGLEMARPSARRDRDAPWSTGAPLPAAAGIPNFQIDHC